MIGETEGKLVQWGIWSRRDTESLGTKSVIGDLMGHTGRSRSLNITDDEGMTIDAAVSRLNRRDGELGRTVVLAYVIGMPHRQIARVMNCSRASVAMRLKASIAWIDCALELSTGNTRP